MSVANIPSVTPPFSIVALSGANSITISWNAVLGADSYRLYRSTISPISKISGSLISTGSLAISYTDTTVSAGTRYYYILTTVRAGVEGAESSEVSAVPGDSGTVSGMVLYEDKEYGQTGFTGNTAMLAVRYATVEVVNASSSAVLYSARTDSHGTYSVPVAAGPTEVYVRVLSEAAPATAAVTVKHLNGSKFGVPSINLTLSGSASVNISIPAANPAGGAFNILDVLTNGYEFVKYLSGAYPTVPLSVFWEEGNLDGTYYCTGCPFPGDGIYVLNSAMDTDEFDDDVLYHEFGHFVAASYSRDDSPGGPHALSSNDLDMRLSWSEGWGDFFPGALKSWLFSNASTQSLLSTAPGTSLSRYVDTVPGGAGISFDFGGSLGASYRFATNETAIANILWKLQENFTVQPIWDVIRSFTSTTPSTPVNLEAFWDGWYILRSLITATTELATVNAIYTARSITYANDIYESDDSLPSASTYTVGLTLPQVRTLYSRSYPAADADVVLFPATTGSIYTITTSSLLNGADTTIAVYDHAGNPLSVENDNRNNFTYASGSVPSWYTPSLCDRNGICHDNGSDVLGSQVSFVASTSGTYSVKIVSSPLKPVSAGRYGSYTLKITSP